MQSDEFDKKIKEAADHHHPAYDEKAWMKMEKLLDTHLPQKKDDRRRIIFFLFLFLIIGGGVTLFFIAGKGRKKDDSVIANNLQPDKTTTANETSGKQESRDAVIDNKVAGGSNEVNNTVTQPESSLPASGSSIPAKNLIKNAEKRNRSNADVVIKKNNNAPGYLTKVNKPVSEAGDMTNNVEVQPDADPFKLNNKNSSAEISKAVSNNEKENKEVHPVVTNNPAPGIKQPVKNEAAAVSQVPKEKPVKIKNKKSSFFSLNFSAGPDISFAGSGKPGKAKLLAGAGFGYTFKDRFTIRTGFYASSKIYSAAESEYHAPAIFYVYYPYLEKVEADCKVYEIPLSFSYNFNKSARQNWLVSAGLSSYIMKKETYNYFYKTAPSGPTVTRQWSPSDKNKHYFSVLTLSGGYQKNISKSVSLMIEPYLKLPLKGVGYGKVKLNSSGVLFTVGIKPLELIKKSKK